MTKLTFDSVIKNYIVVLKNISIYRIGLLASVHIVFNHNYGTDTEYKKNIFNQVFR